MGEIDDVLGFWLEPLPTTEEELAVRNRAWFGSDEELDARIRKRFGELVERARDGGLGAWAETPRGALALVILIDQFSRNLYRGSAEAFSRDALALSIARAGFEAGAFEQFGPIERLFVTLPFHHAEDVETQKRAVALAVHDALAGEPFMRAFLVNSVDSARKHLDVIVRFGRFPHRNAALGRPSTPEEAEYLTYLQLAGQWL